ncbi:MAG: hypothetical protein U1G07_02760 [Verrucomicrobiota bacterium]
MSVLRYDDNDASRRNSRDVYFYSVEAVAARYVKEGVCGGAGAKCLRMVVFR